MRISSYSEFRRNLAAAMDRVNADREPLVITRDRGKPMAVLMSLEDFASYEETRHLLRSAKNAERLLEAIGNSSAAAERSARSPNEARFQRARLGGLPLLAGERSQIARSTECSHQGMRSHAVLRDRQARTAPRPIVRLVVSAADARAPSCLQAVGRWTSDRAMPIPLLIEDAKHRWLRSNGSTSAHRSRPAGSVSLK